MSALDRWGCAFARVLVRLNVRIQWYALYRREGFNRRGAWHLAGKKV